MVFVRRAFLLAFVCGALASPRLVAHHSFAAEFDVNQPITMTGVLTEVKWENPHMWIYLTVADASGMPVRWGFEAGPPITVQRMGVKPADLKLGEPVTINAFRARDMTKTYGQVRDVTFKDGRTVILGAKAN